VSAFRRSKATVCDLRVSGEAEAIGVTPNHPFWSPERNDWVAVRDLRIGERLQAADGSMPVVESVTLREEPEPVVNIEVEGDHCYRVGQQGLLVHNMSQPTGQPNPGGIHAHSPCGCPGTPGGTPTTPPSGNTNPPPPRPHFSCAELHAIVVATSTGTAITSGGAAGGALIRLVASRGLHQADTASQIEEGREFIHWYFGPDSWNFSRISGNTGTAIIYQGAPAVLGQPFPVMAIRDDGVLFRGSSARHLMMTTTSTTFIFDWNTLNPTAADVLKVQVWQSGNWVTAP
jgi:hypothetical protein